MLQGEPQPGDRMAPPEDRLVLSRVDLEDVGDVRRDQLAVELLVLREEAAVPVADVKREERRAATEAPEESVCVRGRAARERLRPGWVGRMEVAGPRLDHRECAGVVQADDRRAVATGGQADDRASSRRADRAGVRVDVVRTRARDVVLPVATRAPVQILGIGVLVTRALWE